MDHREPARTSAATLKSVSGALLILIALGMLGGCNYDRLKKERDQLWVENEELHDQSKQLRMANDALNGELEALRDRQAAQPQQVSFTSNNSPGAANTGFSAIEGIDVVEHAGSLSVRVPGDVLFSSGKVTLKSSAKSTLKQIASVIKDEFSGNTIRVEGYTDKDPIRRSKWKDNLELSLQRAASVQRYLQSQGISSDQIYSAGFGAATPQATKAKSRRVEIVVVLQ